MTEPVTANAMVDAHILIYACRHGRAKDNVAPDLQQKYQACAYLLRELPIIRLASVAWLEFQRGLKPLEQDALKNLRSKIRIDPIDGPVADKADQLLKARSTPKLCPRCLNSEDSHSCGKCGRNVSSQQRLNDALIVATAETKGVDVLYAYDGGVLEFGRQKLRCRIRMPGNGIGPLFDSRQR